MASKELTDAIADISDVEWFRISFAVAKFTKFPDYKKVYDKIARIMELQTEEEDEQDHTHLNKQTED